MSVLRLTVAVPTYRRPELLRQGLPAVLDQVNAINRDHEAAVLADVLVIDNDAKGSARDVVTAFAGPRYVIEPVPGIVAARNRALDEATGSDLLVFIDDDERPRPQWLSALVGTYQHSRATAVMGRVVTVYDPAGVDPRITAGELFVRQRWPTGTIIPVAAAGNLLLDLAQIRELGVRFDDRLGLSGGEDTLFSRSLVQRGGRIVFCDDSIADDHIAAERLTRKWLRERAISQGNVKVSVDVLLAEQASRRLQARAFGLARGLLRVGGGAARTLLGTLTHSPRHQALGARATFRGIGMIAGAAGHRVEEYARPSTSPDAGRRRR